MTTMAPPKKKTIITAPPTDSVLPRKSLLTKQEVADLLSITTRTIDRMRSTDEIPAPVMLRSRPRWRWLDLKNWIDTGCGPVAAG